MRKVILSTFVTLDGLIEGPEGQNGWNIDVFDEEMERYAGEQLDEVDTLLLGRVTYDLFADAWPREEGDVAGKMNAIAKVVFSRTPRTLDWNNSRQAGPDLAAEIAALKAAPGKDMLIYGSAALSRDLMRLGLIDEYRMWVHPVILGKGKPLFEDFEDRVDLELVRTRVFEPGVCILYYRPA
ncbi:dihydrofolate reductase family protein [Sphaerisporangium sp. TRM90804]|uniref:dihydrofolate reductase family protein n=1 Tax=Sphaerisporangium sp. TRM90804 TaxID=3031113 RepID=UPI00244B2A65|nr:dihydrofolate reductase family protein [Sphaerisporangium sp. TRM90804]MDH2424511.1 dihydrofolate reductase family protein [Sphaerisporangium sp. TRM90804]